MQVDFVQALRDIGREKDIPLQTLSEIIEAALVSAYKKHFGAASEIHVDIDWDNGTATVFCRKRVVEHVENPHAEMSLAEARRLDPTVREDEYLDIEMSPTEFGRIAAQTAKQVVAQRIREAERDIIYEEFSNRDGDVVTGLVARRDGRTVFIDIGKVEAILPASEQSPLDSYRPGERIKVYILEVKRTTKIPRVLVSRSHPGLLRKLFELEVPEVHEGIVEIKAQARESGARSKIAVASRQERVDPVGACVGHRGSRVQAVVDELRGEKVDIVRWSDDPAKYVAGALSPAKVSRVQIDPASRSATVIAPDNQLSLAIGREGQNVRLAARLTGWRIDIRSEAQAAQEQAAHAAAAVAGPPEAAATAAEGLAAAVEAATETAEPAAEAVVGEAEAVIEQEPIEAVVGEAEAVIEQEPIEAVVGEAEAVIEQEPIEAVAGEAEAVIEQEPVEAAAGEAEAVIEQEPVEAAAGEAEAVIEQEPVEAVAGEAEAVIEQEPIQAVAGGEAASGGETGTSPGAE